jgi:GTP cyclohydrolase II
MSDAVVAVERAAGDLRRGLPVVVLPEKGPASLIASAELAGNDVIDAMARWSGAAPHVLLTHHRAATLKIRLYTERAVAVALPKEERARAAMLLADPTRDMNDPLMGPWKADRGELSGAALAAIQLAKSAELLPAVIETRIDRAKAMKLCRDEGLLSVAVPQILSQASSDRIALKIVARAQLPLAGAENTRVLAFRPSNGGREHLALIVGSPEPPGPVLIRLHSECLTGDLLGSLKCDCGDQLRGAVAAIGEAGTGILLYLPQEGRGIGLINKLKAYELQDQGFDTIDANQRLGFEADEREFAVAAEMLKYLGFASVRLMTNNPDKVAQLARHGVTVIERVPHKFPSNPHNAAYIATKKAKAGHLT